MSAQSEETSAGRGRTFDIRGEAESAQTAVKGKPIILLAFLVLIPLAVGTLSGRIGFSFGLYGASSWTVFVVAASVAVGPSYLAYRSVAALGPVTLDLDGLRIRMTYADGRGTTWDLERMRSLLVVTIRDDNGNHPTWTQVTDANSVPTPFIQKWTTARVSVSNAAANVVKEKLKASGWTETLTETNGPKYRALIAQMRAPRS